VRNSFDVRIYTPVDPEVWQEARVRFVELGKALGCS
jgi:hypothetical protein